MNGTESRPLCVDLDGTLIRTDLLAESVFALLKRNIFFVFMLPLWFFKGKARLKHEIATRVDIDVGLLPYHSEFLDYLKEQHNNGRRLILATASNGKFAEAIALDLSIFEDVLASNASVNLSGSRKLRRLQELFGDGGFDYAGNAMIDVPLWESKGSQREQYIKALRIHQWLKNLLVFIPLVLAHRFGEPVLLGQALLAFLAFSLCASSAYLLNDLLDLPDDRQHPTKRDRPFAAGTISVINGAALIPGLLLASFGLALFLPVEFIGVLLLYYVMTLAYSLKLKRAVIVDVLMLASLYTLRIIAGAAAISVVPSFWLLAFSMFLFLSLALVKRYTEVLMMQRQERNRSFGRGYGTVDLETISQFGSSSAYMAVLVLALYINSEEVRTLYTHPHVIWLLCPLLLYMVMRIWLMARRDKVHEDPVVFVIQDRRSQWLAVIGAILLWLAI